MGDHIALLCSLFPASDDKQNRVLDLLRTNAREYYRQPKAKCTTWSYYTPFPSAASAQPVIGGLEIYTSKAALSDQVNDQEFFQSYHETVKKEGLYSKDEELVAYSFAAGFIARKDHALPFGGTLISQTRFICKDKAAVLAVLEGFISFVREQEPFVLTYVVFERKKNPKELLLFVRYRDLSGLKSHSRAPEHTDIVGKLSNLLENDLTKETTVWKEVEDSFVSTEVGGPSGSSKL